MNNKCIYFISFLFNLVFSSCQKEVFIELPDYKSKPVVYCLLKADTFPLLYLTRSVSMYEPQDYSKLGVGSAFVQLNKNSFSDTLKPFNDTLIEKKKFPIGVYLSIGQKISVNSTYSIFIHYPLAGGQTLSSVTSVPDYSPLDSIRIEKIEVEDSDSLFVPYLYFTPRFANSYYSVHYYYKKGKKTDPSEKKDTNKVSLPKYEPFLDGIPFKFINSPLEQRLYIMRKSFEKGDTAFILFRHINPEYYSYLRTSTQNSESGEPVLISSNINGGLGIFGAFTEDRRMIVFK